MSFLESIFLLVALFYVMNKLSSQLKDASAPPQEPGAVSGQAQPVEVKPSYSLRIEGAEQVRGSIGFVKSVGLIPDEIEDLKFVKGPVSFKELPTRAKDCVASAYEQGNFRGMEVGGLLHRDEPIPANQSLYFALVTKRNHPPYVVAFVDKSPSTT